MSNRAGPGSHVIGPQAPPLRNETITQCLRRTVASYSGRTAVVVRQQRFRATYGEFLAIVERVARGLVATGVRHGDRVGLLATSRFEWLAAQYATGAIGGILVPVNPYGTEPEIRHVVRNAGVRTLLHAGRFHGTDLSTLVGRLRRACPELRRTIDVDREWAELLRSADRVPASRLARREASISPAAPAAILYTSGTTARPKGVTLSHHSILSNAYSVGQRLGYGPTDRVCVPVPLFHCFGLVLGSLASVAHGARIVVPSATYDATAVLESIQAEACTSTYGVPTMYARQLSHPEFAHFDLRSLRTGIIGGSACPPELVKRVVSQMHIPGLTIAYGMTETSPISIQTMPDDPIEVRATAIGRVLPHLEVRIVDPADGRVVPRGTEGEILVRGYPVMLGYWNDPEATRAAVDGDGWMHTGDLGVLDPDSRFRYTGRVKDMIIVGGENVSPVEVENQLVAHPAVDEAQVIGVPDAEYGERVMAWVRLAAGARVAEGELASFCRDRLAGVKVPSFWRFVDDFPTTASGKVRKAALREISSSSPAPAEPAALPE